MRQCGVLQEETIHRFCLQASGWSCCRRARQYQVGGFGTFVFCSILTAKPLGILNIAASAAVSAAQSSSHVISKRQKHLLVRNNSARDLQFFPGMKVMISQQRVVRC